MRCYCKGLLRPGPRARTESGRSRSLEEDGGEFAADSKSGSPADNGWPQRAGPLSLQSMCTAQRVGIRGGGGGGGDAPSALPTCWPMIGELVSCRTSKEKFARRAGGVSTITLRHRATRHACKKQAVRNGPFCMIPGCEMRAVCVCVCASCSSLLVRLRAGGVMR